MPPPDQDWMACPYAQRGSPPKVRMPDACHHLEHLASSSSRSLTREAQRISSRGVRAGLAAAAWPKTGRHRLQTAVVREIYAQKRCTQVTDR